MRLSNIWNIPYVHSVISNGKGRNEHGATGTACHRIEIETQVFTNASIILCYIPQPFFVYSMKVTDLAL